jgi:methylenetetrahydrofolate reductase (NADH)
MTTVHSRGAHKGGPRVSFEFFPPNSAKMDAILRDSITRLAPLNPQFVSVTYGADGATRDRTHKVVEHILTQTNLVPAAHLTCVGAPRQDVDEVIRSYWDTGVRHVVALRGDPPEGLGGKYVPHTHGYENAAALVAGIKAIADFEISVSAYPEKHPQSADFGVDFDMLQAKIDNGATRAITQFFFDNDAYFRYLDKAQARNIDIPIVPGLIPIVNFKRICQFAEKCGTSVPPALVKRFEGLENDPEMQKLIAAAVAAEQASDLKERGIEDFHFYTMNRADLVYAICRILGLSPDNQHEEAGKEEGAYV